MLRGLDLSAATVARVMREDGLFLAVTHSEESFTGILDAVGLVHESCPLLRTLRRFSSEKDDTLFVRRGVRGG